MLFRSTVFHKEEEGWVCYNDTRIEQKEVPWDKVYMLVYESEGL